MNGNKYIKSSLITTLLLLGAFSMVSAQRMDTVINNYGDKYRQENLYFQFDRPAYAPGETVWFKGYILAGTEPSVISKNLYIDFSDINGKVLAHLVYPIVQGGSNGQFTVPDSLAGNALHMVGYTNWMRNFDSAFLFQKDIRIIKPSAKSNTRPKVALKPEIAFFPEGGDMVAGLKSNIAFKANDQFGRPVNTKGTITDSKGGKIAEFHPQHDGMGRFSFIPQAGETYTANWTDGNQLAHKTPLPSVKNVGITLEVSLKGSNCNFLVKRTDNAPETMKQLHIVATLRQQVAYMANIRMQENTSVGGTLDVSAFPSGVLQMTIFDQNWKPLAERICFVNNITESSFTPEVGLIKMGLQKRGYNELVIRVDDTTVSNLSVGVTDAGLGTDSAANIISRLLLTGDLRGAVYHPNYYTSDTTEEIQKNLDVVMMTHGWRRYNWDNVFQGQKETIKYPADTSYLTLAGQVFGSTPDQLRAAGDLFVIAKPVDTTSGNNKVQTFVLPVNPNGSFGDPEVLFFDSLSVHYQFTKKRSYSDMVAVKFMNNRILPPKNIFPDKNNLLLLQLSDTTGLARSLFLASEQERLAQLQKTTTLESVSVTTKAISPMQKLDDTYSSGLFKGGDAYQFDLTNDMVAQSSMNLLQYLQGRVAGLQISNPTSNPSLSWRGGTPQIYLDEMPTDISMISNLPMTDIAYVKVFRPPFVGGFGGGSGGAIVAYTKKGGAGPATPSRGLSGQIVAGYSAIKEFYVPNYGKIDEQNEKPDVRPTLYWNPVILTDPTHSEVHLKFYNNDLTNSFRIILEGMNNDGKLTHIEKVIE